MVLWLRSLQNVHLLKTQTEVFKSKPLCLGLALKYYARLQKLFRWGEQCNKNGKTECWVQGFIIHFFPPLCLLDNFQDEKLKRGRFR